MTPWSLVGGHQRVSGIYSQDLPPEILNDLKELIYSREGWYSPATILSVTNFYRTVHLDNAKIISHQQMHLSLNK